jgi:hypothetical protein
VTVITVEVKVWRRRHTPCTAPVILKQVKLRQPDSRHTTLQLSSAIVMMNDWEGAVLPTHSPPHRANDSQKTGEGDSTPSSHESISIDQRLTWYYGHVSSVDVWPYTARRSRTMHADSAAWRVCCQQSLVRGWDGRFALTCPCVNSDQSTIPRGTSTHWPNTSSEHECTVVDKNFIQTLRWQVYNFNGFHASTLRQNDLTRLVL